MQHTVPLTTVRSVQYYCVQWLLLIVAVYGLGRSAEATCGDHLGFQQRPPTLHSLPLPGASQTETTQPPAYPVCLGTHCQRREPIPARPTNESSWIPAMEGVLTPRAILATTVASHLNRMVQAAEIEGPASRVFRPPRVR